MMSFLMGIMFLIPLSFFNSYWMICFFLFMFSGIFMTILNINHYCCYISWMLGVDMLSFLMMILSIWVCSLMILASAKLFNLKYYSSLFSLVVIFLLWSLLMTFSSMNLFGFYLFFEISLIPTLLLILGWGYQPERLEAGLYLLFYTMVFSLPMMLMIFYNYYISGSLFIYLMNIQMLSVLHFFCFNMIFMVKIPMFFIHLWLPKAHVEAPVSGSMILAGIMLKLGGYGLLRFMKIFVSLNWLMLMFILISLLGGFIVSLICLRQSDIKSLIAYSSVAHMGIALSGIMTLSVWGAYGSIILMIGHGLCSSGLFCLANISYERSNSRSLYLNKGLINLIPSLSLWWFLFSASNMAAPPSLNLLGEIALINSLVSFSLYTMILLSLMSFFSACYSLFLYAYTQHGSLSCGFYSLYSGSSREYNLLFLHWFPLNLMILKGDFLFNC